MHKFIAISAYVSASILASAALQVRGMLPGGAGELGIDNVSADHRSLTGRGTHSKISFAPLSAAGILVRS
jgi:hypothetical protein